MRHNHKHLRGVRLHAQVCALVDVMLVVVVVVLVHVLACVVQHVVAFVALPLRVLPVVILRVHNKAIMVL